MRRIVFLLICLSFAMNILADDNTQKVYNIAKEYYMRGLSQKGDEAIALLEKAKEGFELCLKRTKNSILKKLDIEDLNRRISDCDNAIRLKQQQVEEELKEAKRKKAERDREEADARKAEEQRVASDRAKAALAEKNQKRIDDKLVYISADAKTLNGKYSNLHNAIKGNLRPHKFTSNKNDARWGIYINANAREFNNPNNLYIAYVDATVQVVDLVAQTSVFEQEYSQKGGHTKDYSEAVKLAYNKIIEKISFDILEIID